MDSGVDTRVDVGPSPVQAMEEKLRDLEHRVGALEGRAAEDRVAIIIFSGDLDRVLGPGPGHPKR